MCCGALSTLVPSWIKKYDYLEKSNKNYPDLLIQNALLSLVSFNSFMHKKHSRTVVTSNEGCISESIIVFICFNIILYSWKKKKNVHRFFTVKSLPQPLMILSV